MINYPTDINIFLIKHIEIRRRFCEKADNNEKKENYGKSDENEDLY